ncbi:MAG: undecaprenyldiphospho-muramoylpentapeptide beta-N-acetylglucosaminyltransferase [Ignavibacteria bacterium]|nr:undecaprenyldiphospho-muramoylpentapeptide beta-N-acetylglucosaminyltransferase [Ignavibacteria bacterium]
MNVPVRVLFAGGGTGGHLYPAIAMADEIRRREPDSKILFIGTKGKIEERVVPAHGYALETIRISGLRRSVSPETLLFPLKLLMAIGQSYRILRRWQPAVVVGTGGYVSGPVLYAATVAGIPTLIQEQNSFPGVTTRLLAGRVDEVHLSFEESRSYLKRGSNPVLTGNPTRQEIGSISKEDGRTFFGLDPSRETILIFGGSQGAGAVNKAVGPVVGTLVAGKRQVIWQTGEQDFTQVVADVSRAEATDSVKVFRYIEKMEYAYGAASLAVCRSGASTIAELLQAGVPSVLIPYPHAAADHQAKNASSLGKAGAAVVLPEAELTNLAATILSLFTQRARMNEMEDRARKLSRPDAAGNLATAILKLAERGR